MSWLPSSWIKSSLPRSNASRSIVSNTPTSLFTVPFVGRVLGLLVGHVLAEGVDRRIGKESPAEERMR
jgi:hypothetical protein